MPPTGCPRRVAACVSPTARAAAVVAADQGRDAPCSVSAPNTAGVAMLATANYNGSPMPSSTLPKAYRVLARISVR